VPYSVRCPQIHIVILSVRLSICLSICLSVTGDPRVSRSVYRNMNTKNQHDRQKANCVQKNNM